MEWFVAEDGRCIPVDPIQELTVLLSAARELTAGNRARIATANELIERVRRSLHQRSARRPWPLGSRLVH
jgi:hypothetical protein